MTDFYEAKIFGAQIVEVKPCKPFIFIKVFTSKICKNGSNFNEKQH